MEHKGCCAVRCPVAGGCIACAECRRIRAVFEETAGLQQLPAPILFTDRNQIACLHCLRFEQAEEEALA